MLVGKARNSNLIKTYTWCNLFTMKTRNKEFKLQLLKGNSTMFCVPTVTDLIKILQERTKFGMFIVGQIIENLM